MNNKHINKRYSMYSSNLRESKNGLVILPEESSQILVEQSAEPDTSTSSSMSKSSERTGAVCRRNFCNSFPVYGG